MPAEKLNQIGAKSAKPMRARISNDSIEKLEKFITNILDNWQASSGDSRSRFEYIDRLLQREVDVSEEAIKSKLAMYRGDGSKMPSIELPLTFVQFDSALAWLASVFSTGYPVFRAVTGPELGEAASQMNTLVARDQNRFGWMRQINKALAAALRYNVCGLETYWKVQTHNVVRTRLPDSLSDVESSSVRAEAYSGNSLKAMDMYNTFYDTSCAVSDVHIMGAFAGYIEPLNYIQVKQYVANLNSLYVISKSFGKVFKTSSSKSGHNYYVPNIDVFGRGKDSNNGSEIDWGQFFGADSKNNDSDPKGGYEKVVFYGRIIPVEFGIKVPKDGAPQIWKLVTINGILVYAEPITSGHNYLPITFSQLYDYDIGQQAKSFVESIAPFQHLGSSIVNGLVGAMRRNVSDRMFYNPAVFNPDDIKSTAPNARIPVKLNRYIKDFGAAAQQIPFSDTQTPAFRANLEMALGLTNQVTGINQAQQGNFVQGNKTLGEFSTVMNKADSRMQLLAMNLETSLFYPTKQNIKMNYLINAAQEVLPDPERGTPVTITPQDLRKNAPDFAMADGLIPVSKMGSTQALVMAMQLFGQIPDLSIEYDIAGIAVEALRQRGFTNIDSFKRTPEEIQKAIAQQQAMRQGAQNAQQQPEQ